VGTVENERGKVMREETNFNEYRMKPSRAYKGRYEKEDSKYYTDGTMMLLRKYVSKPTKRILNKATLYHGDGVSEESCDRVFLNGTDQPYLIKLAIDDTVITKEYGHNMVNLHTPGNMNCITLDADKVKLILSKVKGAIFWAVDESDHFSSRHPVVIKSGSYNVTVGLLMPMVVNH